MRHPRMRLRRGPRFRPHWLLLLLASLAACASHQTTWFKFHHDVLQTGASPFSTASNTGALKWKFATGGAVRSSPAIDADGTLYVGSGDGKLYALRADGTEKWTFATGGPVDSSPAIDADGTVYVGSADGALYAVNPDGTLKWKNPLGGGALYGSPGIAAGGGTIYIGSSNGYFYAVDSAGTLLWKFFLTPGVSVVRSPAIGADGTIYIGAESPDFYALSPAGTVKWNFTHSGNPGTTSAAVGLDGVIYVGSQDHNLYALNPDGSVKWSFPTGFNIIGSSPAIGAGGTVYVGSGDGTVYAVDSSGALVWKFPTGTRIRGSSPAIGSDGVVYVGSGDGNLYALRADGTEKWTFATGGPLDSSPAIGADGTVYFGSDDHNVYALGSGTTLACPLQPNQYTWTLADGGWVKYTTLSPFPIPAGGTIVQDVAAGDANCVHDTVVPFPGGFHVPPFCIAALGFTISIAQSGCGIGRIDSNGGSDFSIAEVGDTSSAAACGLSQGPPCSVDTDDGALRLDVTVGDGAADVCASPGQANAAVVIPTDVVFWADKNFECPDSDGVYDPGTDTLIVSFPQTFDLTTDSTSGDFRDLDADGCCIAGAGPASHTNPCNATGAGPPTASGSCIDLAGLDVAGTDVTVVAAGAVGSRNPVHDITFDMSLPIEMTTSGAFSGAVCTTPPSIDFAGTATRCVSSP